MIAPQRPAQAVAGLFVSLPAPLSERELLGVNPGRANERADHPPASASAVRANAGWSGSWSKTARAG